MSRAAYPPRAPWAARASPRPQGRLRGPQTGQKRAKTREKEIDLPQKAAASAGALRGLPPAHTPNAATTGAAHTPSTGPPKTPCSWSTSGTPPTPGNLLRQISSCARHAGKSRITQLRAGAEVRDMRDTPDTQVADPIYTEGIWGRMFLGGLSLGRTSMSLMSRDVACAFPRWRAHR